MNSDTTYPVYLPEKPVVVSLFDGMGCIWEALDKLGVKPSKAYSSEIDWFANVGNHNAHGDVEALGDVRWLRRAVCWSDRAFSLFLESAWVRPATKTKWTAMRKALRELEVDLICAGSPCQGFSFAGKQLNFDDPRSRLFFEFVRLLEHWRGVNPSILFLLENVCMAKRHETVITQTLGVPPAKINSALVSAQNRDRLYWCNFNMRQEGLFGDWRPHIPQPADRGIVLADILEPEVDAKYLISDRALRRMFGKNYSTPQIEPDKTGTLNTKNNSGQLHSDNGTTLVGVYSTDGKLKRDQGKSRCLVAGGNGLGNHSDMDVLLVKRNSGVRQINPSTESGGKQPYQQNRVYADEGKSPAHSAGLSTGSPAIYQRGRGYNEGGFHEEKSPPITANSWQNNHAVGCVKLGRTAEAKRQRRESMANGKDHTPFQGKEITGIDFEKSNCLTTTDTKYNLLHSVESGTFRRLTPVECCRLQTVRDDFFLDVDGNQVVSDTQIYKMLGNGWTVDVIVHLLSLAVPPEHPSRYKNQ